MSQLCREPNPPPCECIGDLLAAIESNFGSFDIFRAEMTVAVQGSGWGWLVRAVQ